MSKSEMKRLNVQQGKPMMGGMDASRPVDRLVIKPCPCGRTPEKLYIHDTGQGGKWANVSGDCCGEWEIEFRTGYHDYGSDECMTLAITAWNEAPRAL